MNVNILLKHCGIAWSKIPVDKHMIRFEPMRTNPSGHEISKLAPNGTKDDWPWGSGQPSARNYFQQKLSF